jgi:hypothetical protein
MALALTALALGQAEAPVRMIPNCALGTPNGDAVAFRIVSGDPAGKDEMWLAASEGSVWPTRTLVGDRARTDRDTFAFGGEHGLVLEMYAAEGDIRPISIRRREGSRIGLPLAYGYCRSESHSTVIYPALDSSIPDDQIGDDIRSFDATRWPADDCGLILSDGRRMRFRFNLAGNLVRLSSASLWSGRPVSLPIAWQVRRGAQLGTFGRANGPAGDQTMYVSPDNQSAVKLINLSNLGDSSVAGQKGFAICGYRQLVRTAVQEL